MVSVGGIITVGVALIALIALIATFVLDLCDH